MISLEEIAANAAETYCRCSNCNGVNPDMGTNCCKERSLTCNRYFIGYETALIALEQMNEQLGNPVEKVQQEDSLGLKTFRHWVNDNIENELEVKRLLIKELKQELQEVQYLIDNGDTSLTNKKIRLEHEIQWKENEIMWISKQKLSEK